MLQRSQEQPIDFYDLVDDIMDEIARQLGKEDPNLVSPMAIKLTRLSSNLRPEFARTLETRLIARLSQATSVKMAMCAECTALRSRVENGNWILTLGAVNQDDLRRIGAQTGVKTFMELDFTYSPGRQRRVDGGGRLPRLGRRRRLEQRLPFGLDDDRAAAHGRGHPVAG